MPSSDHYQREALSGGFTPNNVWATSLPEGAEEEMTLPSGQTCLARKLSVQSVITTGLTTEVDSLTGLVDKHTRKVKGGNKVQDGVVLEDTIMQDTEAIGEMMKMVDALIPHVVISPSVLPHWTEQKVGNTVVRQMIKPADREPGMIYTDQIDLADKMHLFEWSLGGLAAFSSFRGEAAGDVGSVEPGEGARRKAKRRSRRN